MSNDERKNDSAHALSLPLLKRAALLTGQSIPRDCLDDVTASLTGQDGSTPSGKVVLKAWKAGRLQGIPAPLAEPQAERCPLLAIHEQYGWVIVQTRNANGSWTAMTAAGALLSVQLPSNSTALALPIFARESTAQAEKPPRAMALIWKTIMRRKGAYLNAVVATLVVNTLTLATSIYALQVYDRVIPHAGYETLTVLASGVGLAILIELILKHSRGTLVDRAGSTIDAELSEWLLRRAMGIHLHHRPPFLGTFASQIKGIEFLQGVLSSSSFFLMTDVPFALFFIWVIFAIGGPVGLVPLVLLPVALLAGLMFQHRVNRGTIEKSEIANFRAGLLVESIDAIEAIKANGAEWGVQSQWRDLTEKNQVLDERIKRLSAFSHHLTNSLLQLGYVGLVSVGAVLIIDGELTIGALIACSIISSRALAPIGRLPGLMLQWAQLSAAVKSLDRLIQLPNDLDELSHALHTESLEPSLRLNDVKFRYAGNDLSALEVPALSISKGERIGIVGPVGSGKSTLLKLASGLFRPSEGRVLMGGIDMALVSPQSLRESIGFVSQDLRLIRGTLRDNILQGLPDPGDEVVLDAARATGLHHLINGHPKGLALPIAEGGRGISGGQKQLIGLTRLLLAKPSLLLLDEPTASMDSETEGVVVRLLHSLAGEKKATLLMATHKSALLPLVDRLLVVKDGRIILDGPRDAVLGQVASSRQPSQRPSA